MKPVVSQRPIRIQKLQKQPFLLQVLQLSGRDEDFGLRFLIQRGAVKQEQREIYNALRLGAVKEFCGGSSVLESPSMSRDSGHDMGIEYKPCTLDAVDLTVCLVQIMVLSHITQGKYDRVGINEKMEVSVYAGTHVCSPKQLSTGTLEQIYFALRISLGEILTDEEPMPFLLDETFARYDETRIRNTLQWIGTQGRQMILFTCHKREMEYLDEMGIAYHKIELEGQ